MKRIIRKADELEMAINMKAVKFAYLFVVCALFIYCVTSVIKTGEAPATLLAILSGSGVIFWGVKLYETNRLAKQSDDDEE